MNRRQLLGVVAGTTSATTALEGCTANETTGRTYRLRLSNASSDLDDPLDLDNSGITPGQADIVATAVAEGEYAEEHVNWSTLPGREGITMAFKMLLQLFARHAGHDPTVDEPTTFETPTLYDGTEYVAIVDVEAE